MSSKLSDIPTDDLRKEIADREEAERKAGVPKQLENPDFGPVIKTCQAYIDALENDGWASEEFPRYVFEEAMTAIFGNSVWKWVNKFW